MRLRVVRLRAADLSRSAVFWCAAVHVRPEVENERSVLLRSEGLMVAIHPAEGRPDPGSVVLSFQVDDLEAVAARLVEAGGRVASEPRNLGEVREMLLLDPDGHRIELHEWKG